MNTPADKEEYYAHLSQRLGRLNEIDIVMSIQELLDGKEWTPDTLEAIAALLRANGYQVRDV
jgi:hypothetical protein